MATPIDGECKCGRGLPRIRIKGGRVTDFLTTPDGRIVSGASLTIYLIANTPGIRQAQLIQEKKQEVIIRLVKGSQFSDESVNYIRTTAKGFLGENISITIDYVDDIPQTRSGKSLFCISNVNPFS